MPYVLRDSKGQITRASARPIMGGQSVPYNAPELVAFLKARHQDPKEIEDAFLELRQTDTDMSRAIEDVVMALLRRHVLQLNDLPKPVQDRIALRVRLRVFIQSAYDQASRAVLYAQDQHPTPSDSTADIPLKGHAASELFINQPASSDPTFDEQGQMA